jgi:hypothetical protein
MARTVALHWAAGSAVSGVPLAHETEGREAWVQREPRVRAAALELTCGVVSRASEHLGL